jgi:RNA-binding protein with serine-rich domain 1
LLSKSSYDKNRTFRSNKNEKPDAKPEDKNQDTKSDQKGNEKNDQKTETSKSNRNQSPRSRPRQRSTSRDKGRSKSPETFKIHVDNLTRNVNAQHLEEIFGYFGKIKRVEILLDRRTNIQKGSAYIDFLKKKTLNKLLTI